MTDREQFAENLKKRIDEVNADLDTLSAKAQTARAEVRQSYSQALTTLKQKRDKLGTSLHEIRRASGGAWVELKDGADQAWKELNKAWEEAKTRMDDQVS